MDSDVLNTKEATDLLKAHIETLRRLARRGDIPAFKVGKDWRFLRKALLRWAAEHHMRNKPPCILIVDDDPSVRNLIGRFLEAGGYRFRKASDGAQGLAYLEDKIVDLILLDLKMPGINGPEFLHRLRETGRHLPIVVITGYPDSDLMADAMRYGPIMLVTKPIEREQLLQAVRTTLDGALKTRNHKNAVFSAKER